MHLDPRPLYRTDFTHIVGVAYTKDQQGKRAEAKKRKAAQGDKPGEDAADEADESADIDVEGDVPVAQDADEQDEAPAPAPDHTDNAAPDQQA
jgi:hypothetical protein